MNALVAQMLGEADFHSPEERADLDRHGEADTSNPEETKEVQLAKQILAAAQAKDLDQVVQLASELIRMHHPQAAASYAQQMTGKLPRPKAQVLSMMAAPVSQSYPSSP